MNILNTKSKLSVKIDLDTVINKIRKSNGYIHPEASHLVDLLCEVQSTKNISNKEGNLEVCKVAEKRIHNISKALSILDKRDLVNRLGSGKIGAMIIEKEMIRLKKFVHNISQEEERKLASLRVKIDELRAMDDTQSKIKVYKEEKHKLQSMLKESVNIEFFNMSEDIMKLIPITNSIIEKVSSCIKGINKHSKISTIKIKKLQEVIDTGVGFYGRESIIKLINGDTNIDYNNIRKWCGDGKNATEHEEAVALKKVNALLSIYSSDKIAKYKGSVSLQHKISQISMEMNSNFRAIPEEAKQGDAGLYIDIIRELGGKAFSETNRMRTGKVEKVKEVLGYLTTAAFVLMTIPGALKQLEKVNCRDFDIN